MYKHTNKQKHVVCGIDCSRVNCVPQNTFQPSRYTSWLAVPFYRRRRCQQVLRFLLGRNAFGTQFARDCECVLYSAGPHVNVLRLLALSNVAISALAPSTPNGFLAMFRCSTLEPEGVASHAAKNIISSHTSPFPSSSSCATSIALKTP